MQKHDIFIIKWNFSRVNSMVYFQLLDKNAIFTKKTEPLVIRNQKLNTIRTDSWILRFSPIPHDCPSCLPRPLFASQEHWSPPTSNGCLPSPLVVSQVHWLAPKSICYLTSPLVASQVHWFFEVKHWGDDYKSSFKRIVMNECVVWPVSINREKLW